MMTPRQYAAIGACAMLAASAFGAEKNVSVSPEILFASRIGSMRETASTNSVVFSRYLDERSSAKDARNAWQAVTAEFSPTQLHDFFTGANVLLGPVVRDSAKDAWNGVFALYNPWLDAILVGRLNDDLKLDRLAFLGGEAFRGESVPKTPTTATVVPDANPLSTELWRVQSRTVARFRELYPEQSGSADVRIPPRGVSRDWPAVQARLAVHLKLLGSFAALDDWGRKPGVSKLALAAMRMQEGLRFSDSTTLKKLFADPSHAFFCDTFAELPARLRQGFALYGYVPSRGGTLFVFLSPAMPRVYATVSFPANRENDPAAGTVVFEWYDLARVDKLLEALESESPR